MAAAATFAGQPAARAAAGRDVTTGHNAAGLAGLIVHRNTITLPELRRDGSPLTTAQCEAQFQLACYSPAQVQQAYHAGGLFSKHVNGAGRTIVVIDEFGSPTIAGDLARFDHQAGLSRANLKIITPVGGIADYDSTDANQVGWAAETTLDVEWAHVLAPGARIVLLEAPDADGLINGLRYAIDHRVGDTISLSWSGVEQSGGDTQPLKDADGILFRPAVSKHITIVDATGDLGVSGSQSGGTLYTYPVADWPATDPNVIAVGGSLLHLDGSGRRESRDTVWNDTYNQAANNLLTGDSGPNPIATGGGRSVVFGWPYYQAKVGPITGWRRGIPDIVMTGACSGAVDIYQSFAGQPAGWNEVCGTSESAPLFAGVTVLADQAAGRPLGMITPALYQIAAAKLPGIVPVTSGNNTVAFTQDGASYTVTGYSARNGYSMAAGLGTIDLRYLVQELAHPRKPAHAGKPARHGH